MCEAAPSTPALPPVVGKYRQDNEGYFICTKFKWVIIRNKNYELLKAKEGFEGFANIDEVDQDAINVKRGIKQLGAKDEDIIEFFNTSVKEMQ